MLGLRSRESTARAVVRLLNHWTDQVADADGKSVEATLAVWQSWYASEFPDAPPATPPTTSVKNKWSYEELAGFLQSPHGTAGSAHRGAAVFKTAQCSLCHRFGSAGEGIGPDLTTVSKRFHTKEILESVLYPSHVISDQYESKVVVANGRQIIGLVAPDGENAIVVLQQDGTKKRIFKDDVEEIVESKQSTMPDGLLNALTLDQVADLLAYLRTVPQTATATAADGDETVRR
jgi:putative heme-binding domain-containing protein